MDGLTCTGEANLPLRFFPPSLVLAVMELSRLSRVEASKQLTACTQRRKTPQTRQGERCGAYNAI